jgi:probable rRNA maturation factor
MPKTQVEISFNFLKPNLSLTNRIRLKEFLIQMVKLEGKKLSSLNFIFCSDQYLLKINQQFLKHSSLTDIITFPLSAPMEPISADIYISTDRVRDNAQIFHSTIKSELHRVIFHGVLHLCGYKDKSPSDIKQMRDKEDYYLSLYGA